MKRQLHFWFAGIYLSFACSCLLISSLENFRLWPLGALLFLIFSGILLKFRTYIDRHLNKQWVKIDQTSERLIHEARDKEHYEEALLRNENKFKNFVSNSPDGIVLTDEAGVVTEWNRALSEIAGISRESALGAYCWDLSTSLFPASAFDIPFNELNKEKRTLFSKKGSAVPSAKDVLREAEIDNGDGQIRTLQIKSFYIPGGNGNKQASIIRDVTSIKEKDKSIREKVEQLRAIFDNTHQSFILLDTKAQVVDYNANANTRATDIFGAHLAKGALILDFMAGKNREELEEWINVVKCGENVQAEINILTSDGEENWYEFHLAPVYDDDMLMIGIFLNFFDIQLRKKSEEEIRHALNLERELNRLKSQFVSSVSHEFRTPLASIYSNVQLLHHSSAKWDETRRENTFGRIYSSISHMTALLQNVSLLGKGQSGMHKFEPVNMDVIQLCRQVIEESESNFDRRGRVLFETKLNEMEALLDINLAKHILINLLNNALKYSDEATTVRFELGHENPNMLIFTINDQGVGIADDDLKSIFEPFIRGNNVGSVAGTGLGMAIVKQCIEVHNGTIHIDSTLGKGTMVKVKLPYQIAGHSTEKNR